MTTATPQTHVSPTTPSGIDPRGPRFGAALTVIALVIALLAGSNVLGTAVIAWQTLVFALGAFVGLSAQPYGVLYRKVVRPRLGPPAELEDPAPPRFAQLVGFLFAVVGLISYLLGATVVGQVAIGLALAAAFLNAAFNFCLGCEIYLVARRLRS
ncbi:MAG: DUF4395 domain-containing protein [Actinobacteria bacterium]|nr:DUF4395 domain-containing protein [Actinomycetota bacterium]